MEGLPKDILRLIVAQTPERWRLALAGTCRRLRQVCLEDATIRFRLGQRMMQGTPEASLAGELGRHPAWAFYAFSGMAGKWKEKSFWQRGEDVASALLMAAVWDDREALAARAPFSDADNLYDLCVVRAIGESDIPLSPRLQRLACLQGLRRAEPGSDLAREIELYEWLMERQSECCRLGSKIAPERFKVALSELDWPGIDVASSRLYSESKRFPLLIQRTDGSRFALHCGYGVHAERPVASAFFRIIQAIWIKEELDLPLLISDAVQLGSIEDETVVVEHAEPNSWTVGDLMRPQDRSLRYLFRDDALLKPLVEKFGDTFDPDLMCRSYAATITALHVLGMTDLHNGMLHFAPTGHFFASDVYFFLRQTQKPFFGIPREHAPFCITLPLQHVLSHFDLYDRCIKLVAAGMHALQPHIHQMAAAIVSLLDERNYDCDFAVEYVRDRLCVHLSYEQLEEHVKKLMAQSLRLAGRTATNDSVFLMARR